MSRWHIIRGGHAVAWDVIPGEQHTDDIEMAGFGLKETNSIVSAPVKPSNASLPEIDGRNAKIHIKPLSWNVVRFKKEK